MKKNTRKSKKKKPRRSRHSSTKTKKATQSNAVEKVKKTEPKKVHQTPARRDIEKKIDKKTDGGRSPFKFISIAGQFLREARSELKKVKWPTRKELLASTGMVIILVIIVSFYLGIIDFGLIKLIKSIAG